MSLALGEIERLAGRTIIAGFEGTQLPSEIKRALAQGSLGGIILFKRNIKQILEFVEIIKEINSISSPEWRPIICIDQEGGRVVRLKAPLTVLPAARKLGDFNDPELTEAAGKLVGLELGALGITLNFAPVLDVDTATGHGGVIGDRCYGQTPVQVVTHGLAFARGLKRSAVVPCAKHFPGHGDAGLDSHVTLPEVAHDATRLRSIEIAPFAEWVTADMGPIMTAHVMFPSLDAENPATCSRPILTDLLRHDLGFKGVIFSDDMEMGAVSAIGDPGSIAIQSIRAGVDGLLVCRRLDIQSAICEALSRAARDDPAFANRLHISAHRIGACHLKAPDRAGPGPEWVGSDAHRAMQTALLKRLDGKPL
ncbi:MAG: beta-N-acetylhexosaminidase [Myxococcota bacterium]|nr:beta-N-acetylhexosaminidase [Myxococcota bacterium]